MSRTTAALTRCLQRRISGCTSGKSIGVGRLRYPLFTGFERGATPVESFDALELRSGSHDMVERGFYLSNPFTDAVMLDMGQLDAARALGAHVS